MFLAFREAVASALADALTRLDLPAEDLGIEEPPEGVDAVLASSVAFRLAGSLERPPPAVAAELADAVDTASSPLVGQVEAAGPYVNFHPAGAYYQGTLEAAIEESYGRLGSKETSVVVEHTSANPTGPIHVGRARNPILGDAIARVLDFAGYDVDAHYYVNDAGRQIAVFTWAYERFDESDLDTTPARDRDEYDLVRYYRKGNEYLETADADDVEGAERKIAAIMQGLEAGDEAVFDRVQTVVDQVLGGMRTCLARLPAEFDDFVKESRFMRDGSTDDIADRLKQLDVAFLEEDAWQLDLEDAGIEKPLVFLRSDGTSLYTTRDLAHHEWKLANYDRAVTVLGEDHKLQAEQLTAALDQLGNETDRIDQVFYSWVNLPEGGMSTREGTGIDLDDLLDEAIDRARGEVEKRIETRVRGDLTDDEIEAIAHDVGIGAVRYDIVSKQPTKGITFRWEEALDFEAQSAPYVQYVHARTCGILEEAETVPTAVDAEVLETDEEQALLRAIARFPAVIEEAADEIHPHVVATYTRDLAEAFNAFYRECPVLNAPVDPAVRDARLALVAGSQSTVANALGVLGIQAPDVM